MVAPSVEINFPAGMSNADDSIDDGLEDALRADPGVFTGHAGWDFYGRVWWDAERGVFVEQVLRYRAVVDEVTAGTLRELMTEVNDRWGWE